MNEDELVLQAVKKKQGEVNGMSESARMTSNLRIIPDETLYLGEVGRPQEMIDERT